MIEYKKIINKKLLDNINIDFDNIPMFLNNINIKYNELDIINYINKLYYNKNIDKHEYAKKISIGLNNINYYKNYIYIIKRKTYIYYKILYFVINKLENNKYNKLLDILDIRLDNNKDINYNDLNRLLNVIIRNIKILIYWKESFLTDINSCFTYNLYSKHFDISYKVYPTKHIINFDPYIKDETCIELSDNQKKLQKIKIYNKFINRTNI